MKKFLGLLTVSLLMFFACSKKEQTNDYLSVKSPKHTKTLKGGCFVGKSANLVSDTIYYELNNDTLLVHITININCSSSHLDLVRCYCEEKPTTRLKT